MKNLFTKVTTTTFIAGVTAGFLVSTALGQGSLGSSIFPDVPSGSYYDAAVGEMASLGIITGFSDGTFKPNEPLTRGQAAVLMKRIRDEIKGIRASSASSSSSISSSSSSSSVSSSSLSSTSSSSSSLSSIPSAGLIRFTTSQYKVNENAGTATITIVRAAGNRGQVNVDYKLVAGTATANVDYEVQEGTAVFDSGETSTSFEVKIKDDSSEEGDETFTIELSNPTGGAGFTTPDTATVLIEDDETATTTSSNSTTNSGPEEGIFAFSAVEYSVLETEGTATVRVIRKDGSKGSANVSYDMTNGTADSSFYTKSSGTLSFADGETEKSFTVTIIDNEGSIDGNKTVNITLSNPTGGAELDDDEKSALLTIHDADVGTYGSGSLKLSKSEYNGYENDGYALITVRRVSGASGQVSVKYKTIAGTATSGTDYTNVDNILTFKHGEGSKSFIVPIKKDSVSDGGETVTVRIQDAVGASITSPSQATLYIY